MRTYKRTPRISDNSSAITSINKTTKFNNQMTFTGINVDTNIYNVDQNSQTEAVNVYVNEEMSLVSREPLVEDILPSELVTQGRELIDIKETNGVKIFVQKSTSNDYYVTAIKDNTVRTITCYNKYHLSIFNQYVICFRTEGAQVIDTTKSDSKFVWYPISNQSVVPITKITEGYNVTELPNYINQFTNKYIEQFIRTSVISTSLPKKSSARFSVKGGISSDNINISDPHILTDYRLTESIRKWSESSYVYIDSNDKIVAMYRGNSVDISYDYGRTFIKAVYPEENPLLYSYSGGLTKDGRNFIYYTNGPGENPHNLTIYTLDLATLTWTKEEINNTTNIEVVNLTSSNKDTILIVTRESGIFIKTPYRNNWINIPANSIQKSGQNNSSSSSNLLITRVYGTYIENKNETTILAFQYNGEFNNEGHSRYQYCYSISATTENSSNASIRYNTDVSQRDSVSSYTYKYIISGIIFESPQFIVQGSYISKLTGGTNISYTFDYSTFTQTQNNQGYVSVSTNLIRSAIPGYIYADTSFGQMKSGVYITNCSRYQNDNVLGIAFSSSEIGAIYIPITQDQKGSGTNSQLSTTNNTFYIRRTNIYSDNQNGLFTNQLVDGDSIIVEYTYTNDTGEAFSDVPNLSYSGSELYLAFGNELKITSNEKDGSDTKFYLPKINNQSFPNTITNLLNISTTELAVFFENGILIATKGTSETLGTVYSYAKTRLSLGVRLGDDVINTLDGANSIFPTIRGLAIMNYQAYMATTDQVLSFVTDKLGDYWDSFYAKGNIKILQMKDYIFISNQTNEYLMLDTRNLSWWLFKIPVNVTRFLTDQKSLQIVSNKLYKLDKNYNKNKYIDFDGSRIEWSLTSQRLHFGLPNHYKNLKQIIFQLIQSSDFKNTINTRIKLYRKVVTYRDPDIIDFKIDEYRTFVKRFNYWKINELQWTLSNDPTTAAPAQLIVSGIDIKYEIGEEVR